MLTPREFMKLVISVLFLIGLCSNNRPLVAAAAPFWPRFHGPKGDNISTETGLLKKWLKQGPELVWTVEEIGHGFAGVTVADGMIYTAGDIGDDLTITAMDMNGQIQWQVNNGAAWRGSVPGARGTPTVDGNRLYHENTHGHAATCRHDLPSIRKNVTPH